MPIQRLGRRKPSHTSSSRWKSGALETAAAAILFMRPPGDFTDGIAAMPLSFAFVSTIFQMKTILWSSSRIRLAAARGRGPVYETRAG